MAEEQVETEAETVEEPKAPRAIRLPSAESLDGVAVGRLLASRPGKVITILGAFESGKTGILTGIFARLKKGQYGSIVFANSESMRALESRYHGISVNSKKKEPKIERTKLSNEMMFLHFGLWSTKLKLVCDLYLSDIDGELCDSLVSNTELVKKNLGKKASDHYVLVIDGAKVLSPGPKAIQVDNCFQLFQRLLDAEVMGVNHNCQIVVTKIDEILAVQDGNEKLLSLISEIKRRAEQLKARVARLNIFGIAATPKKEFGEESNQYEELIQEWLKHERLIPAEATAANDGVLPDRFIDKLGR